MKKCFLLIILLTSTHLSYAQYINAVMINSCGTEGNTELFLIKNGPLALTVAPANIDLRYGTTSPASTTYTDNISATGNTAVITALNALLTGGCDFTFINAPLGSVIPAGARIMVLDFDILPAEVSNYSNWCGAGAGNIYVIFSTDTSWSASGNFANTPASSRFFQSIISGTTINYSYDENWTPNADGDIAFWRATGGAAAQYQNYPSCSPPAIPLPVVLTHFEGQSEKSGVNVFWKTSTEINNANFEVQKSRNARSFETIAKVNGNGNSQDISAYSFIDEKPFEGSN
jgi:hypothetical protein